MQELSNLLWLAGHAMHHVQRLGKGAIPSKKLCFEKVVKRLYVIQHNEAKNIEIIRFFTRIMLVGILEVLHDIYLNIQFPQTYAYFNIFMHVAVSLSIFVTCVPSYSK